MDENKFMNEYYRDGFMFLGLLFAIVPTLTTVKQLNLWWGWLSWSVSMIILMIFAIVFFIQGFKYQNNLRKARDNSSITLTNKIQTLA